MNRNVGYTSWSLSCRNTKHMKKTCSVLIDSVKDKYTDVQWKAAAKYVNVEDLKIRNHNTISRTTFIDGITEAMNDMQKFSEIKESALNAILR